MRRIYVQGVGAVSPAGWGVAALVDAVSNQRGTPVQSLVRQGVPDGLPVRLVATPESFSPGLSHPRMRRSSPISHYAVGAAIEALGRDWERNKSTGERLGVICCAFAGCVSYSRRFFDEVLRDPSTASPLIFPETVFNAPASHLSAVLGTTERNYTLVGDQAEFLKGLALGAGWICDGTMDGCLVVAAEEADWLTADALRLLSPGLIASEGAGAVYLNQEPSAVELTGVTQPNLYLQRRGQAKALLGWEWPTTPDQNADLLCDGLSEATLSNSPESKIWRDWTGPRMSPKRFLGEGLSAGSAWQVVAAVNALRLGVAKRAFISVVGLNEQAIGAVFSKTVLPGDTGD